MNNTRKTQRIVGALFFCAIAIFSFPFLFGGKEDEVVSTPEPVPDAPVTSPQGTASITFSSTESGDTVTTDNIAQQIEQLSNNSDNLQFISANQSSEPSTSQPHAVLDPTVNEMVQEITNDMSANAGVNTQQTALMTEAAVENSNTVAATQPVENPVAELNTESSAAKSNKTSSSDQKTEAAKPKVDNSAKTTAAKNTNNTQKINLPSLDLVSATTKSATPAKTTSQKTASQSSSSTKKENRTQTASTYRKWAVQVGVFSQKSNADNLLQRYKQAKYPAYIETVGAQYKVRLGPYSSSSEANKIKATLIQAKQAATVVGLQ